MSYIICSISGNPCEEPVVSKKTGHIFERSLIEKIIQSSGQCPLTGQSLTLEDIIPLQSMRWKFANFYSFILANKTGKPRPVECSSIPKLLSVMKTEWDALVLECFTLKQQLEAVRQELSHALYQHDAACRVIARMLKEREEEKK